jgi:hypothetical protein
MFPYILQMAFCIVCGERFASRRQMRAHVRRVHDEGRQMWQEQGHLHHYRQPPAMPNWPPQPTPAVTLQPPPLPPLPAQPPTPPPPPPPMIAFEPPLPPIPVPETVEEMVRDSWGEHPMNYPSLPADPPQLPYAAPGVSSQLILPPAVDLQGLTPHFAEAALPPPPLPCTGARWHCQQRYREYAAGNRSWTTTWTYIPVAPPGPEEDSASIGMSPGISLE